MSETHSETPKVYTEYIDTIIHDFLKEFRAGDVTAYEKLIQRISIAFKERNQKEIGADDLLPILIKGLNEYGNLSESEKTFLKDNLENISKMLGAGEGNAEYACSTLEIAVNVIIEKNEDDIDIKYLASDKAQKVTDEESCPLDLKDEAVSNACMMRHYSFALKGFEEINLLTSEQQVEATRATVNWYQENKNKYCNLNEFKASISQNYIIPRQQTVAEIRAQIEKLEAYYSKRIDILESAISKPATDSAAENEASSSTQDPLVQQKYNYYKEKHGQVKTFLQSHSNVNSDTFGKILNDAGALFKNSNSSSQSDPSEWRIVREIRRLIEVLKLSFKVSPALFETIKPSNPVEKFKKCLPVKEATPDAPTPGK